jgi:hypothetical protein
MNDVGLDEFCQWIDYRMESTRVRSTGQELWCFRILTLALTLKVTACSVFMIQILTSYNP